MLYNLLTTVIRDTFLEKVGKHNPGVALILSFSKAINYEMEHGYRYFDLVITAPDNYVQVWLRERWNVIKLNDTSHGRVLYHNNDVHPIEATTGKNYTKGESDWELLCDHDSCCYL